MRVVSQLRDVSRGPQRPGGKMRKDSTNVLFVFFRMPLPRKPVVWERGMIVWLATTEPGLIS
jgi:hypothetical protein